MRSRREPVKVAVQRSQRVTSGLEEDGLGAKEDDSGDVFELGYDAGENPCVDAGDVTVNGDEPMGV